MKLSLKRLVELQGIIFLHDLQNIKIMVYTVKEKSRKVILSCDIYILFKAAANW